MKNAVQKWGNSLGLRIPAAIASEMGIERGTAVTLKLEGETLMVRVSRARRRNRSKLNLKNLIAQITPDNLEPTYDWGPDIGREIP